MSKQKRILFIFLLLFISVVRVYADDGKASVFLNCPSKINKDSEFTCTLTANTNVLVKTFEAQIKLSNNLSYVEFKRTSGIGEAKYNNNNMVQIMLYGFDKSKGDFEIGQITFKNNKDSNSQIQVDQIFFSYGNDYEKISVNPIIKNIQLITSSSHVKPQESQNPLTSQKPRTSETLPEELPVATSYLKDLHVEGYRLPFSLDKYEYELKIQDEKKLDITPIPQDDNYTYKMEGNNNLKNGSLIKITIIPQAGDNQVYTIRIIKDEEVVSPKKFDYKILFIVLIILLIIVNLVRIFMNRRKKNEEDS